MMNGEPACTRGSGRCAESRRCSAGIFCRLGHGKLEEQAISAADRRLTDVTADHQLPDRRNLLCKKYAAGSIFQDQHKSGVSFSGISAIHRRAIESADRRSICRDFERTDTDGAGKDRSLEEDWDLFLQTLGHLGYLDARMQIRLLENGRAELAAREEKLQHQLPEQKKVWQSLGILGGAFLVVILI